jgi:hypothetical protein
VPIGRRSPPPRLRRSRNGWDASLWLRTATVAWLDDSRLEGAVTDQEWLTFAKLPALGLAITIGGQRYDLRRHEPYRRRDGGLTTLLVWTSACLECGAEFICKSASYRLPQNRRCDECKRPGVRFDPERKKRIADAAGGRP